MTVAFINMCHADPAIVARSARKLTRHDRFDMYVHVDQKTDMEPFAEALTKIPRVYFANKRHRVYWGGFNYIAANVAMLKQALESPRGYDYFVILQNLDYPTRSNDEIYNFFEINSGVEFIRGCRIARTKDWHYARKYKIFNRRDDDFYLIKHSRPRMYLRYIHMLALSAGTFFFDGVIRENGREFKMHYGAAQWAITRELAKYIVEFYDTHPKFNKIMEHVQSPDEAYFHTIVHNSIFKKKCVKYDEPVKRWLVNWRNLHYFDYPKEVTVMTEDDYDRIMSDGALFVRKVRTGVSDGLLDMIDSATRSH